MAFLTDGTPVGWSEGGDYFVRMDLEAATATITGDSLSSAQHGMCVSNEDMVYFTNMGPMYVFSPETGYIGAGATVDFGENLKGGDCNRDSGIMYTVNRSDLGKLYVTTACGATARPWTWSTICLRRCTTSSLRGSRPVVRTLNQQSALVGSDGGALDYAQLATHFCECSHRLLDVLGRVGSRQLDANPSLSLRHDRVAEPNDVDATLEHGIGHGRGEPPHRA